MKEKIVFERPVSRRRVLTASALLAAAGFASSPLAAAVANAVADFGVYEWTACVINCGQRCPLRAYTKNGTVIRIETDNTGDPEAGASATAAGCVSCAPASRAATCASASTVPID